MSATVISVEVLTWGNNGHGKPWRLICITNHSSGDLTSRLIDLEHGLWEPLYWGNIDGTYGYRTPIYMLNRIIRLQAVVEIITNETALALDLLAKMNSKMRTAIYQNRLALDYLLAKEGGLCGKFNLTNCCLEIDDTGEAIREITKEMRKLAHVPVQTWKGIDTSEWFGGWFEWLGGFKSIMGIIIAFTCVCLVVPCLLPIVISTT
uniref:Envelope glycoprotein n=1 Tax=Pelusios castaneus TaxID=367368 RepID=A0A8C8SDC2_9SAUR